MSSFVLDTSVTMSWFFEDEATPESTAVLDLFRTNQALVPSLWPLEVANVILVAERRGRTSEAKSSRFVALLNSLPIVIDPVTADQALAATLHLGRQFGLSSYDAAYLELAMRAGCPLATLDEKLRGAAEKCGVSLMVQKVGSGA
jgi:predicted nucleic acid-binding protein